jgi:hypothetical protein
MGTRNTSSSLVVEVIPTMQKIRRRKRASPDTGYYWKVHLRCLRAQHKSLLHNQFVGQSRQREYYVHKTCYVQHILETMGLKVKLPMILEMDNKGAVDLANNWSIGSCTMHFDVRQCFLRDQGF